MKPPSPLSIQAPRRPRSALLRRRRGGRGKFLKHFLISLIVAAAGQAPVLAAPPAGKAREKAKVTGKANPGKETEKEKDKEKNPDQAKATAKVKPQKNASPAAAAEKDKEGEGEDLVAGRDAKAVTSSLSLEDLSQNGFWPEKLRQMIGYGLSLTPKGLGYKFGSSDPAEGGMDCSGTLYHVMTRQGLKKVPRSSDAMFHWVEDAGLLKRVSGTPKADDAALADMKPGDLLFWTGTYDTGKGEDRISHVMMYLGRTTEGSPVMFGASNGRPYEGKRQNGVSVFDFRMPKAEGKARFVGYGPIPGLDLSGLAAQPPTQGRAFDLAKAGLSAKKTSSGSMASSAENSVASSKPVAENGRDPDKKPEDAFSDSTEKNPDAAKPDSSKKSAGQNPKSPEAKPSASRKKSNSTSSNSKGSRKSAGSKKR